MKNKSRKKSNFIGLFSLFGISSLTALTVASCATAVQGSYYDFVSFDPNLSGNLAILGFKPTSQSLYNSQTEVPDYVKNLNIPTESGIQPSPSNAETWLLRDPGIAYSFNWLLANFKQAESYGFKNLIIYSQKYSSLPSQDFSEKNYFPIITSSSGADAVAQNQLSKNAAIAWDYSAEINDLAQQLDSMVKNKDGSSIFGDIAAKVNNVTNKLNGKLQKFKSALTSENKQPKISFWGKSYGPNYVVDSKSFEKYGPSSQFPGWLYSTDPNLVGSLDFLPAVPTNKDLKFGVFNNGGFNTIGWKADTGEYSFEAVQNGFANSSDYVFVQMPSSLMDQINDPNLIDEIKQNFAPMVSGSTTDVEIKKNKVFIVPYGISLSPYNLLGIDYTINLLANNILGPNNDVAKISAFDLSNLKILSSEIYDFIEAK